MPSRKFTIDLYPRHLPILLCLEKGCQTLPRLAIFLPQPPERFGIVGMCQQAQLCSPLYENVFLFSGEETGPTNCCQSYLIRNGGSNAWTRRL